jgi:beta-glucosidase
MKNDGTLPFKQQTKVTFFANSDYKMSGDGSGSTSATDENKVTILKGLQNNSIFNVVNTVSDYSSLNENTVNGYANSSDVAIVQINRSAGEGRDRTATKGDWYLSDDETNMLDLVSKSFSKVVVLINTPGVIDMAWVKQYNPSAIIYVGTPGQEGGNAVADVLSGLANPSGKLADTWATYDSYSSSANHGAYILGTDNYTVSSTTNGGATVLDTDTNTTTARHYPYWGSVPNPSTGYDPGTYTRPIDEYMYSKYEEGIYVGYRYFDTFKNIVDGLADKVYYPFGYGLSYTNFSVNVDNYKYDTENSDDSKINVTVTVENTGNTAGKDVVELYYGAPDITIGSSKKLENPSAQLAAYTKTDELAPGEKETLTLTYNVKDMASYDEDIASYILGTGKYSVYVGDSLANAENTLAGVYTPIPEDSNKNYIVTEKLSNLAGLNMKGGVYDKYKDKYSDAITLKELSKYDYENTKPDASECINENDVKLSSIPGAGQGNKYDEYNGSSDYSSEVLEHLDTLKQTTTDAAYKLIDVYNGKVDMNTYLAQWDPLELIAFIEGAGNTGQMFDTSAAKSGGASSTQAIPRLGVPSFRLSDGPAQVGGTNTDGYSIAWPTAQNLAMTWNKDLVEEIGTACGKEALAQGTDFWLAPSLNIHRTPLCGRNYEYYSEDPLISGTMAAAIVRGAQSSGVSVAIKHFAGNNQEIERWNNYDSVMSERTLREIYLKGFEIAVKTSNPWGIMTSYGMVNGIHASKNEELFKILKDEWGFDGAIMTDWEGDFGNAVGTINAGSNAIFPAFKGMTSYLWQAWTVSQAGGTLGGLVTTSAAASVTTEDTTSTTTSAAASLTTTAATKEEIGLSLSRESLENAAAGLLKVMMRLQAFADYNNIEYKNPYDKPEEQFTVVTDGITTGGNGSDSTTTGSNGSDSTTTGSNGSDSTSTTSSSSSHHHHSSSSSSSTDSDSNTNTDSETDSNTTKSNDSTTGVKNKNEWSKNVNGTWSFVNSNGEKATGWIQSGNSWYYLNSSGIMQTGWTKDNNGSWYYLNNNGAMKTGWFNDTNGLWYYLNDNGAMKTGWFKDTDGKWYYFNDSGDMAVNTIIDGYEVDSTGAYIS